MAKTAKELRSVEFPDCSYLCALADTLGVGECENFCPYKFDEDGEPKEKWHWAKEERWWTTPPLTKADLGILG